MKKALIITISIIAFHFQFITLSYSQDTTLIYTYLSSISQANDSVELELAMEEINQLLNDDIDKVDVLLSAINSQDIQVSSGAKFFILKADNKVLIDPLTLYLEDFEDSHLPYVIHYLSRHEVTNYPNLPKDSAYLSIKETIGSSFNIDYLITAFNTRYCSSLMFSIYRELEGELRKEISEKSAEQFMNTAGAAALGTAAGYSTGLLGIAMESVSDALFELANERALISNYIDNIFYESIYQHLEQKINSGLFTKYYTKLKEDFKQADAYMINKYFSGMISVLIGTELMINPDCIISLYSEIMHPTNSARVKRYYFDFDELTYIKSLLMAYGGYGKDAIPHIFDGIKNQNEYIERVSQYALTFVDDENAIPMLVKKLNSEDPTEVVHSLKALSNMHATETIKDIEPILEHKSRKVRKEAEETLANLKAESS